MIKYLFISLLAAAFPTSALRANSLLADSLVKVAQADAGKFRLNNADLKKFRKNRRNATSDYFKPAKANVSDTTLLTDSEYVKAYRTTAYHKTRKRRTVWHHVWVGATVLYGATCVLIMAIVFSPGFKGR